ncbi:MAG: exodeoxyribonuclease VII small subunit [Prevotella sp.]|jgi:exodeoxyribonuclease VII small subunit|nr:exodeoxyribonuclease VII small subunit [Prevotella sp.]
MDNEKVISYDDAMKRLEEIVTQMESGKTGIDSLVAQLKEARQLVQMCRNKLLKTEEEINKLAN